MTDNNKSLMQRIRGAGWGAIVLLVAAGVVFWGGLQLGPGDDQHGEVLHFLS